MSVAFTRVGPEPLDVAEHARAVERAACGAVVTFTGVVRDVDDERAVTGIEYVAHPTAPDVLAEVVAEVFASGSAAAAAVSHRVGQLDVGDLAFVVAVSAGHRREAFETAVRLVDEVKARLPVWKRQQFPDGRDEWVGSA
ncbi:molybdenum cofactor biosynthesis protein MoaE [Spongisporangium articulatum]|uniref:Molybdenum cofactor biosynthesis protein MoaE n=1 Tax=Spongisporangium articulatum TaxID=3362603 RepID=A0ABW8AU76_9ACTN